ncbi:hypothetical protein C1E24_04795 [Pseudoalteromonas phenolica]|uniref:Uncharacterized protein n=1 Tax=Pseudoalteromonas phenolica TaxID=161398 RepID=A0A5R9Q4N8_9GAMM|nr:hypothetical protein [Pseudoalteromonas phenolica]TLX48120.1 hypothetical protein C1E24_04795 [Pseudoalteromonas phenolica]
MKLPIYFFLVLFFCFFDKAHARINYESVICDDCSYTEAKSIARRYKYQPELECFVDWGGTPDDQQCRSSTTKLVVYDLQQEQFYGFYIGYTNQGRPFHEMSVEIREMQQVPAQIKEMLINTGNGYKIMTNVTRDLRANFDLNALIKKQSRNSFSMFNQQRVENDILLMATDCSNSPESKAMELAHNLIAKGKIMTHANDKARRDEKYKNSFQGYRITGANFQVALGGFGVGGTVEYFDETKNVITDFTVSHSWHLGAAARNNVVFKLKMVEGSIDVSTDERLSHVGGIPLHLIKNSGASAGTLKASDISPCLADAIDKQFKKTVSSGSNPGSGAAPSWRNIPLNSRGGGNLQRDTCKHTYYDLNGEPLFSFEGPCP